MKKRNQLIALLFLNIFFIFSCSLINGLVPSSKNNTTPTEIPTLSVNGDTGTTPNMSTEIPISKNFFQGIIFDTFPVTGIWVMSPDGGNLTQLTDHGWFAEYSPDNSKIAFGEPYLSGIWVAEADGSNERQITDTGGGPSWSPDSNQIVYFVGDNTSVNRFIWIVNVDGTNAHQLTFNSGDSPKWSPRGDRIVYNGGETYGIWLINPDGSNETLLLEDDRFPSWSPAGDKIAYVKNGGSGSGCIWIMNSDASNQTQVTTHMGGAPTWSPDGSQIAYQVPDGGIWVVNIDGTGDHQNSQSGYNPDWFNNH